jgi:hypothetical protein
MGINIIQEVYRKKFDVFAEEMDRKQKELDEIVKKYNDCVKKIEVFSQEEKLLKIYSGNNIILCNADTLGIVQEKKLLIDGSIIIYNKDCPTEKLCQNRTIIDIVGIDSITPLREEEMKDELFQVFMGPKSKEFEFNI